MEKYTCMSSQHVLPSKQTLSNITKNRNICCHQCHLKYVKNFWANGKSKLPANFTCKHKVTSIGLKYDDRHAEIPKYRVPYTNTFTVLFEEVKILPKPKYDRLLWSTLLIFLKIVDCAITFFKLFPLKP